MIKQGRQVAKTIDDIRDDHKYRYFAAGQYLTKRHAKKIVDVGCGSGYGSHHLANIGFQVVGFDHSKDAIDHALKYFLHSNIFYYQREIEKADVDNWLCDFLVMFEVIEHCEQDVIVNFLNKAKKVAKGLIGSVPNELVIPFGPDSHSDHKQHYTLLQLEQLLIKSGWMLEEIGTQFSKTGDGALVKWGQSMGRTLVFTARPINEN